MRKRLFPFAVMMLLALGAARGQTHDGYRLPGGWHPPIHDRAINYAVLFEKFEFRLGQEGDTGVLDAEGWVGGDYNRFWWKAEGEHDVRSPKTGEYDVQALYGRLFSPYWELQGGMRLERHYSGPRRETRGHLALGLQGIAPYWFELEPTLFVSDQGDVTFGLEAAYEQLITQHWVIEPRVDLDAAFRDKPERGLGAGVNEVEFGLRLRYDITRQISPYVGVTWRRTFGKAADQRRLDRERVSETAAVVGLRAWF